ncbi:MAG: hypothetical protein JXJ04_16555 [Spirochaetales bacterium]|nr:hypothetical protein [Spirochaetales bacterium]
MEQENNLIEIELTEGWIDGKKLEQCLNSTIIPKEDSIGIIIPDGCNIMIDAAIRLLSYVNQLDYKNIPVYLNFLGGADGTLGYLNRIGFFDHLHENIEVLPERPSISRAKIYHGKNPGVFEIAAIDPKEKDNDLPSILTHYPEYNDYNDAELIQKIFSEGLSKDGKEKGCGLRACASHALKFSAHLDLRLPHVNVNHFSPLSSYQI